MSSAALIGSVCGNVENKKRDLSGSQPLAVLVIILPPTSCGMGVSGVVSHPLLRPQVLKIPHIAAEKQSTCICDTYFYHYWEGIFHAFAFWAE